MSAPLAMLIESDVLKTRESDISRMRRDAPTWAIVMNFGLRRDMADVITQAKLYVNRF